MLFVLAAVLLSSCAIHPYFPFICFKKECIQSQFNTGVKPTGGKRGIKQRFKMLVVNIKKKQGKNKKDKPDISNSKVRQSKVDSLISDTAKVADYIKLIFHHKVDAPEKRIDKDSVNVKSSFIIQSKDDKTLINYYLNKYSVKNIKEIVLVVTVEQNEDSENRKRAGLLKARRLRNYIVKAGIKEEKIKIQ